MKTRLLQLLAPLGILACATHASPPLEVHEWGTFTSLQNELGDALPGINTDDEPVPSFVHDGVPGLLIPPGGAPPALCKSIARCHPDVTMRLETPVLYFHPESAVTEPVTVTVDFPGGWLTQFYPNAEASGLPARPGDPLPPHSASRLTWPGLSLHSTGQGPATQDPAWLPSRAVSAAWVRTPAGETERFLFYRGVAHLDAPLRVRREGKTLRIGPHPRNADGIIPRAWLVDIRADGVGAFREVALGASTGTTSETFAPSEYDPAATRRLREALRNALVADGLFAAEAEALLATWEASYFHASGLRLFFLVPRAWTDAVLPIRITGDPPLTRVMVGRIELVSPAQRDLLARIAGGTHGAGAYAALGRFRDALLLEELRRRPTPALRRFAGALGLVFPEPAGAALEKRPHRD